MTTRATHYVAHHPIATAAAFNGPEGMTLAPPVAQSRQLPHKGGRRAVAPPQEVPLWGSSLTRTTSGRPDPAAPGVPQTSGDPGSTSGSGSTSDCCG